MIKKGRQKHPPMRLEENKYCKLTEDDVKEIRRLYGMYNGPELGKMFNVHKDNIYHIVKRKTWTHIN